MAPNQQDLIPPSHQNDHRRECLRYTRPITTDTRTDPCCTCTCCENEYLVIKSRQPIMDNRSPKEGEALYHRDDLRLTNEDRDRVPPGGPGGRANPSQAAAAFEAAHERAHPIY